MNEKTIEYWRKISEYDLITAEAMLKTKRYLYVGFMCHQALEKILKAYYVKIKGDTPPYIHDLVKLADKSGVLSEMTEEQHEFLYEVNPLNIEARYPKYKSEMFEELKRKDCQSILRRTKEFRKWIDNKL